MQRSATLWESLRYLSCLTMLKHYNYLQLWGWRNIMPLCLTCGYSHSATEFFIWPLFRFFYPSILCWLLSLNKLHLRHWESTHTSFCALTFLPVLEKHQPCTLNPKNAEMSQDLHQNAHHCMNTYRDMARNKSRCANTNVTQRISSLCYNYVPQ